MRTIIKGVVPANLLPLSSDYEIDEAEYRRHLLGVLDTPRLGGITCNGHAAEVTSLSCAEWQRSLAIAVDTVHGQLPVVCGIYGETHREAARLARIAASEGANALLVFPPPLLLFDARPEVGYVRFASIAEVVDLTLVVFEYPAWSRMQYNVDELQRICSIETVGAVKEWSQDVLVYEANLRMLRSLDRPVSMLTSFSSALLPSLAIGADGILSGLGSVIPDWQVMLFEYVKAGELYAARSLYERIQTLTRVVYRSPSSDMYTRMKEQLVILGRIRSAVVRPPLMPLSDSEREALRACLVASGLLIAGGGAVK